MWGLESQGLMLQEISNEKRRFFEYCEHDEKSLGSSFWFPAAGGPPSGQGIAGTQISNTIPKSSAGALALMKGNNRKQMCT